MSTGISKAQRADAAPDVETLDAAQRARRDRIVDAAVESMKEVGYEQIQMRDVTARAKVALGTTYRYFPSKDQLLSEALVRWAEGFPTPPPSDHGRSIDRLKQAYRRAVRAFEAHPTVYETMDALQRSSDEQARTAFATFGRQQTAAFELYVDRLAPERREKIVTVMSAVLNDRLRAWTANLISIEEVYESLDDAADLIFG